MESSKRNRRHPWATVNRCRPGHRLLRVKSGQPIYQLPVYQFTRHQEHPMTHIYIYDTTLRDGSQGEGVSFSLEDKLSITRRLDEIGVPFVEGGWPGSNDKDRDFFRADPRRAAPPGADRSLRLDAARGCAVRDRSSDRGAAGSRDAGRHHRRQELGSARASRAGDHARRKPGDDRGERPLSARAGPPRLLRRRALLRRLQGQPGIRPGDHRRGRGRGRGVRHPVRDERRRAAVGGRGDRPQGVRLPERARGRARGRCAGADRDPHAR